MSSFDEGGPGFDLDQIKAQIRMICEDRGWTFQQLCRNAGLDRCVVQRAIEQGARGFPETLEVFHRLAAACGVRPEEFMSGTAKPTSNTNRFWLETKKLLWKFVYKMGVAHSEGTQFEQFLRGMLAGATPGAAVRFRKGVPQNMKDVAWYFQQFRAQKPNK